MIGIHKKINLTYMQNNFTMLTQLGKILITIGIVTVFAGVILFFLGDKLNWLGKLPGDIRIEREHVKFYFPITTMIIISVILSLVIYLVKKIL